MKNKLNLVLLFTLALINWTACKKDRTVVYVSQNNGGSKNGPSHRLNTASYLASFAPAEQRFTLNPSSTMSMTSFSGNIYVLPPNSLLHQDNSPVTGNVEFVLIEYLTKADMLCSGVTTLSGTELLASGSMFYLTAFQNGEELKVMDNTNIALKLKANSDDVSPMDYWVGNKTVGDSNNKVDWSIANKMQVTPKWDSISLKKRYDVNIPNYKFGYSNLDCLHNINKPRYKSWSLDPPDVCNDTNSVAMIIMDQYHASGYVWWVKDVDVMGTSYMLPIDDSYKLLIYCKYGPNPDDIQYVVLDDVVKEDNAIVYKGPMTKTTKAGLKAVIDGL